MIHTLHSPNDREEGEGKEDMEKQNIQNSGDRKSEEVGWFSNA